ncbi:DUF397 domain-containing protein [Streptomyces sp. NPDC053513]|uniref:DUF397 domain-containing protein n=1 Tax=unclassified Streptomyces TaxID=2593676 RepID=UPI0037D7446F
MHEYDLSNARWFKSSYSNGEGGNCVEVSYDVTDLVPVRDSKVPDGPALVVAAAAWSAFVSGLKG